MTEDEARQRVRHMVDEQAMERLVTLVDLVITENEQQNLIARSTLEAIWQRHVLDSVQLAQWAPMGGRWVDIGTGGGFPGLAIAAASPRSMVLVEPRRKRVEFLVKAVERLGLIDIVVRQQRIEVVDGVTAAVISARAVAPIAALFAGAYHCAKAETRWILPRGMGYAADIDDARKTWQGVFHVERSVSDPQAGIVIASRVSPR